MIIYFLPELEGWIFVLKKERDSTMTKLNLIAPWETYKKMLASMFIYDDDVIVGDIFKDSDGTVHIPVEVLKTKKYKALKNIVNPSAVFGTVTAKIDLYDVENGESMSNFQMFKDAFEGNTLISSFKSVVDQAGMVHDYIVFDNDEIVQFPNDDTSDYQGNYSALPADVAKQVFSTPFNVQFCTKSFRE